MASGVSWLMVRGVRARANSRWAQDKVTASRVRIEMIQATSSSNGELNPSSARANSAACGKGRMASRMRAIATSIAKGRLSGISKLSPSYLYPYNIPLTVRSTQAHACVSTHVHLAHRAAAKEIHDGQQND